MKQNLQIIAIIIIGGFLSGFNKLSVAPPKLYPELEQYFKSLPTNGVTAENMSALGTLKGSLEFSKMDNQDYNVVFTSDDEIKSQAAQVIHHTWTVIRKLKRVNTFSCITSGTVNPELIETLKKIGYRIQSNENNSYEIRFSDQAGPILLKGMSCADQSIPTQNKSIVTLCTDCSTEKFTVSAFNLSYKNGSPDEKVKAIATDLYYAIPKK